MTEEAHPIMLRPTARDFAKCGWIFLGLAAFFSIAPAKEIGAILFGFILGSGFSFLAYGAARFGKNRLAIGLLLTGIASALFFFVQGPAIHRKMMAESIRRGEEKRRANSAEPARIARPSRE